LEAKREAARGECRVDWAAWGLSLIHIYPITPAVPARKTDSPGFPGHRELVDQLRAGEIAG